MPSKSEILYKILMKTYKNLHTEYINRFDFYNTKYYNMNKFRKVINKNYNDHSRQKKV